MSGNRLPICVYRRAAWKFRLNQGTCIGELESGLDRNRSSLLKQYQNVPETDCFMPSFYAIIYVASSWNSPLVGLSVK